MMPRRAFSHIAILLIVGAFAVFSYIMISINHPLILKKSFYLNKLNTLKELVNGVSSIAEKELVSKTASCKEATTPLIERCEKLGGELRSVTKIFYLDGKEAGGANNEVYTFGCFPTVQTNDYRKRCNSDDDCEGVCAWFEEDPGFDISGLYDFRGCTDYKDPFFKYPVKIKKGDICEAESAPKRKPPTNTIYLDKTL
jgi:hypothetical protein